MGPLNDEKVSRTTKIEKFKTFLKLNIKHFKTIIYKLAALNEFNEFNDFNELNKIQNRQKQQTQKKN